MPTVYKILGQQCPANTNETTLYTVPSSTSTIVSSLTISNITSTAANATVNIKQGGSSSSNANTLMKTVEVAANSVNAFTLGITLSATDVVSVTSGTNNALTFQLFGSEIS
jgi:uncharacterized phage infection (PIP) family protein YhgE